ncbi:MAG: sugar ABC transporter permease YjfF [Verrucomicrobiota bacterium]
MLIILFSVASFRYEGLFSVGVVAQLFSEKNAILGIAALGMTFVILSGGIDLSVGAVMAFTTIFIATLVEKGGVHPVVAWSLAIILGTGFGAAQGYLIHAFKLPPFLVTLAGMFFARGMAFVVASESIGISHAFYESVTFSLQLGDTAAYLTTVTVVYLVLLGAALYLAHGTKFGRTVYAVGGNENSALLMGLPVARTKVLVYAINGLFAALGGIAWTIDTPAGNPTWGTGLELFVIAAVVIGGSQLSGGVGFVLGTVLGVLVYATIELAITFDGNLSSSITAVAVGVLLLLFIGLQRLMSRGGGA